MSPRHFCVFSISLAALLCASHSWAQSPPEQTDEAQTSDSSADTDSSRVEHTSHTAPSERAAAVVQQAREENWSTHQLLVYLELDDADECLDFSDRTRLRERHARWSEAVLLLDLIDPDALDAWFLGRREPPRIVQQEMQLQLECLLEGLVGAVDQQSYNSRLFPNISGQFGGRFRTASELADAVASQPYWRNRAVRALRRSIFRDFGSQGYIWHRKFVFSGNAFNKISERAAHKCGLTPGAVWQPNSNHHRRCWFNSLSKEQREREILSASAGPGLSRHHWGTDVDVLGINPNLFVEGAVLHDDWRWLDDHGLDYGFFQTYRDVEYDGYAHMNEPWHWSYYPIAQALWDFARHHPDRIEALLFEQWDRLQRAWGPAGGPYFDHLRQHWHDYVFNIYVPPIDSRPAPMEVAPRSPLP